MTVTSVQKDPEALTMRLLVELDADPERAWELWADPRQLERWWGPPTHPATVVEHDLAPQGRVTYFMTSPEGERFHGWWEVHLVDAPHRLELTDGFADDAGRPNPDLPSTRTVVTLSANEGGGTLMAVETHFPSLEAMEQLAAMGMEEGITLAAGQMDAVLAEPASSR